MELVACSYRQQNEALRIYLRINENKGYKQIAYVKEGTYMGQNRKSYMREDTTGRPRRRYENIIKFTIKWRDERMWTAFFWIRIRASGPICKHGTELSGCVKCCEFID
jgi:hypothetical protein